MFINSKNTYYQTLEYNSNPSFQGYINGNYYKDEIISLAKNYRNNSSWKEELRKNKVSLPNAISNWHNNISWSDEKGSPKTNRFFLAFITAGLGEIIAGIGLGISSIIKNYKIEKEINKIDKCLKDLNMTK